MIEKLYGVVVGLVLCCLIGAVIAAALRFMMDIGLLWSAVIILAGVVIWRWASAQQS